MRLLLSRPPRWKLPTKRYPALTLTPPGFGGASTKVLTYVNRRVRVPLARKRLPTTTAVQPTAFGGAPTKFLYYRNRRPKAAPPRKRLPVTPTVQPGTPFGGAPTKFLYYRNRHVRYRDLAVARHKLLPPPGGGPPPPAKIAEWIIRARRRGRR